MTNLASFAVFMERFEVFGRFISDYCCDRIQGQLSVFSFVVKNIALFCRKLCNLFWKLAKTSSKMESESNSWTKS